MTAIPLNGDRSAKDVVNYPSYHSTDLPSSPVHHVPAGVTAGDSLVWNGTKWILDPGTLMLFGTAEGGLEVSASPFKFYNRYGSDREITEIFLSVGTVPTGASIIVDVKVDGVSIFSVGSKASISSGASTGVQSTIALPDWDSGSYITWEITQIGSGDAGGDLTVHIKHRRK